MNYHLSVDGVWRRCRASKRAGGGVSHCVLDERAHAVGRAGIAEAGGGVISEKRANGFSMETTITPLDERTRTFSAISQTGKKRVYLLDGRLLTRKEKSWLEEPEFWKKVPSPPGLRKQYNKKLLEDSLVFRSVDDFKSYNFKNSRRNLERDIFVRWLNGTNSLGIEKEKLQVRFGDDNNINHKEPDIIIQGDDYEKPLGVEIFQIYGNQNQAQDKNATSTKEEFLNSAKDMINKKLNKKYAKEYLGYLILLASNESKQPLDNELIEHTLAKSELFDEAWVVQGDNEEILRLGMNYGRD